MAVGSCTDRTAMKMEPRERVGVDRLVVFARSILRTAAAYLGTYSRAYDCTACSSTARTAPPPGWKGMGGWVCGGGVSHRCWCSFLTARLARTNSLAYKTPYERSSK